MKEYEKFRGFKMAALVVAIFIVVFAAVGIGISITSPTMQSPGTSNKNEADYGQYESIYNTNAGVRANDWQQIVINSPFSLGREVRIERTDPSGNPYSPDIYYLYGKYPHLDGSTVCEPLALEFARQHLGFSDDAAQNFVHFNTTHQAYLLFINDSKTDGGFIEHYGMEDTSIDLLLMTQPSIDELALAEERGIKLIQKPICSDAFVFITNSQNPVDSLTLEQVRKIYSGEITNWSEVGGNDEKIVAYQRNEGSGSQTGMENLVMQGTLMADPPTVEVVYGMGRLVDHVVAAYNNGTSSIGYSYKYYIDRMYINEDIKILQIDGIPPDSEHIGNGFYPLTVSYYGIIRAEDQNALGGRFLNWILSDEGQRCVEQAGYIPLKTKK